MSEVKTETR